MFLLGSVRILQCSGETQGAEPGALRKVRLASPNSPRAWQSLNPWQTEMEEGLALWFNQEALEWEHKKVLPAGTGLIEMCLHYTPFLANWNQNNFKMLTLEWRQEACGCVFELTGIRTWWGTGKKVYFVPGHKPLASFGRKCPAEGEALMPLLPHKQDKTEICVELREPRASKPWEHIFPAAALLTAEGP